MPFGNDPREIPETPKDIGIDFALAARFTQNSQKKIAGCDTSTSHPAITEHRKVRHDNFAPCDIFMLHLATSRYRTLSLSPVTPCNSKSPLFAPKIALPAPFPVVAANGDGFSKPDISAPFGIRFNAQCPMFRHGFEAVFVHGLVSSAGPIA